MRSIHGSLDQFQPLVEVSIGPSPGVMGTRETCLALIDTGATRTCLTQSLIARLGLQTKAKLLVASATSGPERRRAYGYTLGLFCVDQGSKIKTLYVLEHEFVAPWFEDNGNFDVLLGMDIMSRGRLLFEPNGVFSFEFDF
jgi:Aspartyl protease